MTADRDALVEDLLAAGVTCETDDNRVYCGQVADQLLQRWNAEGEALAAQTGIQSFGAVQHDGVPGAQFVLRPAEDLLRHYVEGFAPLLTDDVNYVETAMVDGRGHLLALVVVQRPDRPTPHQKRREAEADRKALLVELRRLVAATAALEVDVDDADSIATALHTARGLIAVVAPRVDQ